MNNNQLPLVTYEQARRLKKAGFDWQTLRYYHVDDGYLDDDADPYEYNWNSDDLEDLCQRLHGDCDYEEWGVYLYSAPTVALALKWMRDVKEFTTDIRFELNDTGATRYRGFGGAGLCWIHSKKRFSTYEAAESALLDELIKLIGNEQK